MPELLLELRSEDIPAGAQRAGAEALRTSLAKALDEASIPPGAVDAWSTPRRITVRATDLPAVRPASRTERRGPRVDAPAKAVEGFCRANGIDRERLEERALPKGRFFFAVEEEPERPASELLRTVVPDVINRLSWPKSMRWGAGDLRWIRPLRGVLCVFNNEPVTFGIGGVTAGNQTFAHRFHAPDEIALASFAEYDAQLREGKVMLDPDERRKHIVEHGRAAAAESEFAVPEQFTSDPLLDELAGLAEWPVVLVGRFDESFLALPREVLTTTMRRHQRYLPLVGRDGEAAPAFLMVANIEASDGGAAVVAGNERVLRARLQDAAFFWDSDRKVPLAERVEALAGIVFHPKLGSMADKARRLEALARELNRRLQWCDEETAAAAARFAKADLGTDLVGEFPELQGVVGGHLARAEGLDAEVAEAIADHYRPAGPHDRCPRAQVTALVALADKLDTLVGFFWQGERPTGSSDPLALRRAAYGLIRVALENEIRIPVDDLVRLALAIHRGDPGQDVREKPADRDLDVLRDFLRERFRVYLRTSGARRDHVAATLEADADTFRDFPGLLERVSILSEFLAEPDGEDLLALHKRAANIVSIETGKGAENLEDAVEPDLFSAPEEHDLHRAVEQHGEAARERIEADEFRAALEELAHLRGPIDRFFESVRVNSDDARVRMNRLRLLTHVGRALGSAAEFSKLEGGDSERHG